MGLSESAASGDRQAALEDLRAIIAAAIESDPPARDLAALSRQLSSVLVELDALAPSKEADKLDDLASARAKRRATAG